MSSSQGPVLNGLLGKHVGIRISEGRRHAIDNTDDVVGSGGVFLVTDAGHAEFRSPLMNHRLQMLQCREAIGVLGQVVSYLAIGLHTLVNVLDAGAIS